MSNGRESPVPLIIGIGNPYRADDAAGLVCARHLQNRCQPGVEIIEHDGEPADLLDVWQGRDVVVVIDAIAADLPAGTMIRIEAGTDAIPLDASASTHLLGLGEAVALAHALGRLPRRLIIYGVVGQQFGWAEELSPPVAAAIPHLITHVLADIEARYHQRPTTSYHEEHRT
jgi:hydrogenase maturation protease